VRKTLLIVASAMVPAAFVVVALVGYDYYERERTRLVRDSLSTVRALAAAVDSEFSVAKGALVALGSSARLTRGDFRAFHEQAAEVIADLRARDQISLINFILVDVSGRQVVNTARPYGEPLPTGGDPGGLARAFDTDAPVISDLFVGPVIKRPGIGVAVPIRRDGRIRYRLTAGIPTERFSALIRKQAQQDRIAAILDTSGTIVARTHDEARLVGQKASPELVRRIAEAREGAFHSRTLEGIPVLTVFSRAPVSGYAVAMGIPERELVNNLISSIARLFVAGFIGVLAALALALVLGRRFLPERSSPGP
jgi:hypothetical protein